MIDPIEAVEIMCERYHSAVSAGDCIAYGNLFCADAIRMPPGVEPEHGRDVIVQSEQGDYDQAKWTIQSRPLDALRINDDWVYGIARIDIHTVAHEGGAEKSFEATVTWLLQKQSSGEWLIKRQMWHLMAQSK